MAAIIYQSYITNMLIYIRLLSFIYFIYIKYALVRCLHIPEYMFKYFNRFIHICSCIELTNKSYDNIYDIFRLFTFIYIT